jgi:Cu/Ag efflux protein CusF
MSRCVLLPLLLLAAGCAERPAEGGDPARGEAAPAEEVSVGYTVRGVFLGALYDGQAATVRHEAVPGLMPAMEMDFRVADPALLEGLVPGDPIRFRLEDRGDGLRVTEVERLPPGTALDLGPGAAPDSTAVPDTATAAR